MQIQKTQTIAGHTALEIRGLLQRMRDPVELSYIAAHLHHSSEDAARLVQELVRQGLIEVDRNHPEPAWRNTVQGNAVAMASTVRISRRTATLALSGFLSRVAAVNAEECPFAYRVETVVLFGSYLTEIATVGDVDLAVELAPRLENAAGQQALVEARRPNPKRPRLSSWIDDLSSPVLEVRRALKGRSRILRLHEMEDLRILSASATFKVLVGHWEPSRRRS